MVQDGEWGLCAYIAYQSNADRVTDTISIAYHGISVSIGGAAGEDAAGDTLDPGFLFADT